MVWKLDQIAEKEVNISFLIISHMFGLDLGPEKGSKAPDSPLQELEQGQLCTPKFLVFTIEISLDVLVKGKDREMSVRGVDRQVNRY